MSITSELLELKKKKLEQLEKEEARKRMLPHLYGQKFFWWQRLFWDNRNRYTFLTCANQTGKDLWAETDIPTPFGFKKLKDIQVGDQVFDSHGKPCHVIAIPWFQDNDTYKVNFNDGTFAICGLNHEWIAKSPAGRFSKDRAG